MAAVATDEVEDSVIDATEVISEFAIAMIADELVVVTVVLVVDLEATEFVKVVGVLFKELCIAETVLCLPKTVRFVSG